MVLLYASKYHDVYMVLNVSGRYNLKTGIEERFGKDFFERIKMDGYVDVKNKTGILLLCVQHVIFCMRLSVHLKSKSNSPALNPRLTQSINKMNDK